MDFISNRRGACFACPYQVIAIAVGLMVWGIHAQVWAQAEGDRVWTDSTGRFKVSGSLIEVLDGSVFLKSTEGKTIKIPLERLSQEDQEFLSKGQNPFETVGATEASKPSSAVSSSSVGQFDWSVSKPVDWDEAEQLFSTAGIQWNVPVPERGELDFAAKRVPLTKKTTFHEHIHRPTINPLCQRGAVGYTVSFAVPKPLSRLSLADLVSGKAVHSEQVEAHMRPLALLGSGSAVLMVGASDQRGGYETPDQLQIWKFKGKKLLRSSSWIPYPMDKKDWGKQQNAHVIRAEPIRDKLVLTMSDKGHVVLWDLADRKPIWHARLGGNFAMDLSVDRKLLALFDDKTLTVVKTETAEPLGSIVLPQNTHVGWPRLAWSPSGRRILFTSVGDVRVLDIETGKWLWEFNLPGGPVAPNALSYPDDDYALLDNRVLVHLPTKIQVCEYLDAGPMQTLGGTSFIAMFSGAGGMLVPGKFPHPAAAELLAKAESDPSLFLIHPGISVAIDVSGVGQQYQQAVRKGLEEAATSSGYKVSPSSAIKIVGAITGPKQEAVSYIASGSYVVNTYTSTIKLRWNGKDLWSRSGTNVPGMLMTERGETIEQALAKAGKQPNTALFGQTRFPKFMQKPRDGQRSGGRSNALMTSRFTFQGLVDSK